ncbi:hypothetical protein GCM10007874_03700 [Labrys miyagiensis]|uniref:Uncharacterized protein n=1 Tax=Labrys miyagiensis TaxID=346912 RepID=A0ABQ6CBN0_9HYPH|nr:hypothetical protein [Labrys miyagiensis]GLS17355.1 hypothetical protein GCM10007874_03700 [Labrys miyagiensis]
MSDEPDSLILKMLRGIRDDLARVDGKIDDTKNELKSEVADVRAELKSDIRSLRADVASDLLVTRKETSEQIVGLRRAVMEYHTSVIGHGVIISELEARVRRMEQHLKLPPLDTH